MALRTIIIFVVLVMLNHKAYSLISNLITPTEYFVNHVWHISEIKEQLPKYRKIGIIGISGIGKTQLVRTYVTRNMDQYNLIWFIDSDNDMNEEFIKLAKAINIDVNKNIVSEDIKTARKSVLEYLAPRKNWLLVLDNIKIKNKVDNTLLIQEISNLEHNGHIIFCSQDGSIFSNTLTLTHLEKKDSMKLIQNISNDIDVKIAEDLAETFHGYPVLIAQGAMFLKDNQYMTIEEYKKILTKSENKVQTHMQLVLDHLPKSSQNLLHRISLINNQRFSKQFLEVITSNKDSLGEDIMHLSKFGILSKAEGAKDNPIFEMHDMVAESVRNITSKNENKIYLEDMIERFVKAIPGSLNDGHVFIIRDTFQESAASIDNYAELYKAHMDSIMCIRHVVLTYHIHTGNIQNIRRFSKWIIDNETRFNLSNMEHYQKGIYARFLGDIGAFYVWGLSDIKIGIEYIKKSISILNDLRGYESAEYVLRHLLSIYLRSIGKIELAEQQLQHMERMFNSGVIPNTDIDLIYLVQAYFNYYKGDNKKALMLADKADQIAINNGIREDDTIFSSSYLMKSYCLHSIGMYAPALQIAQKVFDIHKKANKPDNDIYFGFILSQISRAETGLGKLQDALDHANQAIAILRADKDRNPEEDTLLSFDIDLAIALVARGDAMFAMKNYEEAQDSYIKANRIYVNVCKLDRYTLDIVSYIMTQLAKTASYLNYHKLFNDVYQDHMCYYGKEHFRTKEIQKLAHKKSWWTGYLDPSF